MKLIAQSNLMVHNVRVKNFSISRSGLLVAVGYMDPGVDYINARWRTIWFIPYYFIILISSLSAMLLQSMTVRLGIATDKDLAQMTRHYLNKPTAIIFWIIAELAIIATDIA